MIHVLRSSQQGMSKYLHITLKKIICHSLRTEGDKIIYIFRLNVYVGGLINKLECFLKVSVIKDHLKNRPSIFFPVNISTYLNIRFLTENQLSLDYCPPQTRHQTQGTMKRS